MPSNINMARVFFVLYKYYGSKPISFRDEPLTLLIFVQPILFLRLFTASQNNDYVDEKHASGIIAVEIPYK